MLNKPSKELLLDILNATWKKAYTLSQVDFEELRVMPKDHVMNTQVTVKPIGTVPGLKEPKNVYYNRLNLALFGKKFGGKNGVLDVQDSSFTTIAQLLPQINAAFGTAMDVTDIVDGPIPAGKKLVIKAHPTSFVYFGQFQLNVLPDATGDDDETDAKVDVTTQEDRTQVEATANPIVNGAAGNEEA